MMRTIIAGSRTIEDYLMVSNILDHCRSYYFYISEIVCGGAKGVDSLGRQYGSMNKIPVIEFWAEWVKYGR